MKRRLLHTEDSRLNLFGFYIDLRTVSMSRILSESVFSTMSYATLQVAEISKLPSAVRTGLVRNGCSVPQSFLAKRPENAIAGSFTRIGAREWAVLCSVNGVSSILVFDAKSKEPLSRIAKDNDDTYVQVIGEGRTGFSRRISAVLAPMPGLSAIDDAFLEKASTVWVHSGHRWLETPGAD